MTIRIESKLRHSVSQGDGVRARVIASRSGVLGEWNVHDASNETTLTAVNVGVGDTIDFVVELRESILHDEHEWTMRIRETNTGAGAGAPGETWDSEAEFETRTSNAWERFAQALLMTNEFVFVD